MSYQVNPLGDERVRQRLRAILNEKIRDRTYKGQSFVGGRRKRRCPKGSKRVKIYRCCPTKEKVKRKRNKKEKIIGKYIPEQYGFSEMMGGISSKNPKKVIAGKKSSKSNPWLMFYKSWIKDNKSSIKGMSGKDIAKMAAQDYNRCVR